MTIRCFYTCDACAFKEIPVDVPARGDEDVRDWMDATVRLVWADHWRRSPKCKVRMLTEMKIPMTGADKIGGPVVN